MRLHMHLALTLLAALSIAIVGPAAAAADLPVLDDAITAGVVRGTDGFGTSSVVVPPGGSVTYLVQGEPRMAGRPLEIWTQTRTTDWTRVTARTFDDEGAARYHTRISEWTAFQGRIPGDVTTAGAGTHGRIATVSGDGSTRIRVGCVDFTTEDPGTLLVSRAVGAPVGSLVRVTLCSNASTGFGWTPSVVSSEQLVAAGHSSATGGPIPGAAGTERWSFRVTARGTGYAVLEYSRIPDRRSSRGSALRQRATAPST